ncbi:MAG TPA: hypothetical protein VGZ90_06850 [Puia sp.]|jgi:hypothetical protein|nr:hypothetical protein [Puia sp.]
MVRELEEAAEQYVEMSGVISFQQGVDGLVKYDFGKVDASLFKRKNNKRYQDNLQNNVESPVN